MIAGQDSPFGPRRMCWNLGDRHAERCVTGASPKQAWERHEEGLAALGDVMMGAWARRL